MLADISAQYEADNKPRYDAIKQNKGIRKDYYQRLSDQINDIGNRSAALGGGFLGLGKGSRDAARAEMAASQQGIMNQIIGSQAAFGALDEQKGPQMTPQMLARLRALEAESGATSLAEDPLFQGDRAMLVKGGAQALAGLGSAQKMSRFGTGGQGSIQDVYDRLGVQLSQLGQQSRGVKEQKRDVVAQSYQAYEDSKRDFENKSKQAEAAIIGGNLDAAYKLIQSAAEAEAEMRKSQQAFTNSLIGNVVKGGVMAASYGLSGAGDAAKLGTQTGTAMNVAGDPYALFSSGAAIPGQAVNPFAELAPVSSFRR